MRVVGSCIAFHKALPLLMSIMSCHDLCALPGCLVMTNREYAAQELAALPAIYATLNL